MKYTAVVLAAATVVAMNGSCASSGDREHESDGRGDLASSSVDRERSDVDEPSVLFAYFTGGGEDGMKFALGDGTHFEAMWNGQSVMRSRLGAGLVRDPSIVRGPDGVWHAVWTTGWWAFGFGVAHSTDLINWGDRDWTPVMETVEGTVNSWAPEIHWDPERLEYLVLWSSTVRGRFEETSGASEAGPDGVALNHRVWGVTTKDFKRWSSPKVFFDPGFSVIDAVIVRDAARNRWVMIFKDETLHPVAKKNLRVAFSDQMQGAYRVTDDPIVEAGDWVEGPTVLEMEGRWRVYFDRYRDGGYGAVDTSDWERFEVVHDLRMPTGTRHGCAIRVSAEIVAQMKQ